MKKAGIIGSILAGAFLATSASAQTATALVVPQIAQNGTANRMVTGAFVQITGLTPSATYRYITQAVNPTEAAETGPTFTSGAGNPLYAYSSTNFVYTTTTGLSTAGQYGEFTTDATGAYSGWFLFVPTANARFADGSNVFIRIRTNDGAGGTTAVNFFTIPDAINCRVFGAGASNTTGIFSDASPITPKNIVLLYDNTAGTGRPLTLTVAQEIGATIATTWSTFSSLQSTSTAWASTIPNTLAGGLQRIEERSLTTGAIVGSWTNASGLWPSGANTVNPTGGTTGIQLQNPADYASSVYDWSVFAD